MPGWVTVTSLITAECWDTTYFTMLTGVTPTAAEAWRDYLMLSANGYKRLSDWRQSPTVTDYDERLADSWDIRAEGCLAAVGP